MTGIVCRKRGCGCVIEPLMLPGGKVVDHCAWCARRRAGVCRDCGRRVEGTIGKAIRCAEHKRSHRQALERRRMADPDNRAHKNAGWRRRYHETDYGNRKRAASRAWRQRMTKEQRRAKHRRFLLSEGPAREHYLETQRRHNRNPMRIQKKREHARRRYYEAHPVRPDPKCLVCGAPIAWTGKGRPRLRCDEHVSAAELRRRANYVAPERAEVAA